ncbi:MAG: hypothetical protein KDJ65_26075 [Anaerolineae bacterium]|nr:hypothetical protein [Anaerolineae bacterium]
MLTEQIPLISAENITDDIRHFVNDALIEKIWCDLDKQITRKQIRQAALEVAADFRNATITTFIPIFVHRRTIEKLRN